MLDFESQKKLLDPILKNPKNYLCAHCASIAPTCTLSFTQGPPSTSESSSAATARAHTEPSAPPSPASAQPTSISGSPSGSTTCASAIANSITSGKVIPAPTTGTPLTTQQAQNRSHPQLNRTIRLRKIRQTEICQREPNN